jgi:hypothetical protein
MTYEQAENIAIGCVIASDIDMDTKNEVIAALISREESE